MLDIEFVSVGGRLFRLDSGKIVAVTAQVDTPEGQPRCLVYVAGSTDFLVQGTYKDVLTRLKQKDAEPGRDFIASQEAVDLFGDVAYPTHAQWRKMSLAARMEWDRRYQMSGMAEFRCLGCGYPSGGTATCPACQPKEEHHEENPDIVRS